MCFLFGNDYVPNLQELEVNDLPLMVRAYIKVLPTLSGYLSDCGKLNTFRLVELLKMLVSVVDPNIQYQTIPVEGLSEDDKELSSEDILNDR